MPDGEQMVCRPFRVLSTNEMAYKRVSKLFEVVNGRCCLLTKPHSRCSLEDGRKGVAHIPSKGCYRLKVILKVVIWSNRSLKPSNDSCCRRRNFGGIWHSRTFMLKGESVLLTIPSKWTRTSLDHFSPHFSKEVWICFVRSVWLSVVVSSVAIFIIILVSPNPHGWAILLML